VDVRDYINTSLRPDISNATATALELMITSSPRHGMRLCVHVVGHPAQCCVDHHGIHPFDAGKEEEEGEFSNEHFNLIRLDNLQGTRHRRCRSRVNH